MSCCRAPLTVLHQSAPQYAPRQVAAPSTKPGDSQRRRRRERAVRRAPQRAVPQLRPQLVAQLGDRPLEVRALDDDRRREPDRGSVRVLRQHAAPHQALAHVTSGPAHDVDARP